jgi:hypothetical protein
MEMTLDADFHYYKGFFNCLLTALSWAERLSLRSEIDLESESLVFARETFSRIQREILASEILTEQPWHDDGR